MNIFLGKLAEQKQREMKKKKQYFEDLKENMEQVAEVRMLCTSFPTQHHCMCTQLTFLLLTLYLVLCPYPNREISKDLGLGRVSVWCYVLDLNSICPAAEEEAGGY